MGSCAVWRGWKMSWTASSASTQITAVSLATDGSLTPVFFGRYEGKEFLDDALSLAEAGVYSKSRIGLNIQGSNSKTQTSQETSILRCPVFGSRQKVF